MWCQSDETSDKRFWVRVQRASVLVFFAFLNSHHTTERHSKKTVQPPEVEPLLGCPAALYPSIYLSAAISFFVCFSPFQI